MLRSGRHMQMDKAIRVFAIVMAIWAASLAYCVAHETAHAAAVVLFGGEVSGIRISILGDSGTTVYSDIQGNDVMAIIYAAGLAATTLLALSTLRLDMMPVTALIALRTILSAMNYAPGTDMSRVQALAGDVSIYVTAGLVLINIIVVLACIKIPLQKVRGTFSSLWHARPTHNSPE